MRALLIEGLRMGLETGFLGFSTFSNENIRRNPVSEVSDKSDNF